MSILKPFRHAVLACVAMLAMTSIARATIFNSFGTVVGTNATFTGGERDRWTVDPAPPAATWLFGTPVISGGSNLLFTPNPAVTPKPLDFTVLSPDTQSYEDGALSVTISPTNPAGNIALMSISEGGGYFLQNAAANSSAVAALNILGLVITQVDNGATAIPLGGIGVAYNESFSNVVGNGNFTILPTGIVYQGNGLLATGIWSGNANFNVAGALAAVLGPGHRATQLELALDDIVSVNFQPGAVVSIDKKSFLIATSQNPVPEPASIVMGVLGGLSLAVVGYRKKLAKAAA
jgi:hypothetical protein